MVVGSGGVWTGIGWRQVCGLEVGRKAQSMGYYLGKASLLVGYWAVGGFWTTWSQGLKTVEIMIEDFWEKKKRIRKRSIWGNVVIENLIRAAKPNFLGFATSSKPVLQMLATHCHYSRKQEASTFWIPRRKKKEFNEDSNTQSQLLAGVFTGTEPGAPLVFSPSFVKATGEESPLPHCDPIGAPSSLELALAFGMSLVTWVDWQGQTQTWNHNQKKWKLFQVGPGLISHTMAQNFPPRLPAEPKSFEFQMSPLSSWSARAFSSVWTLSQPRQHLDPIW